MLDPGAVTVASCPARLEEGTLTLGRRRLPTADCRLPTANAISRWWLRLRLRFEAEAKNQNPVQMPFCQSNPDPNPNPKPHSTQLVPSALAMSMR